ncbi:MAG: abortive infection family protein [Cyanobacteria bacterium MAG IRC4_bin_6]|nr:abortive infection family protein [Cyanobacteria bacterium MAG IRC4_bin_6]
MTFPESRQQVAMPISRAKLEALRKIVTDMENFPFFSIESGVYFEMIDDYQHLLIQLQRLAAPLLSEANASRLNSLDCRECLIDTRAEVEVLLFDIKEAIDTQEIKNQNHVITLLHELKQRENLYSVHTDLERALNQADLDPASAVTSACSMVESMCKVYLEERRIQLPTEQTIKPLWKKVSNSLGLDPSSKEDNDIKQVLSGLIAVVSGVGALRTHTGSAHGRGKMIYRLQPRHAWLVINASSTIVTFLLATDNEEVSESETRPSGHQAG